jgi:hypothetical protein
MRPVRREMRRLFPLQRRDLLFPRVLRKCGRRRNQQTREDDDSHASCDVQDVLRRFQRVSRRDLAIVPAGAIVLTTCRDASAREKKGRDQTEPPARAAFRDDHGRPRGYRQIHGPPVQRRDLVEPEEQWRRPRPGCVSTTTEGPPPNFSEPSVLFVADGRRNTGPAPEITRPGAAGDRNAVATMSPKRLTRALSAPGCDVIGMITRRRRSCRRWRRLE